MTNLEPKFVHETQFSSTWDVHITSGTAMFFALYLFNLYEIFKTPPAAQTSVKLYS